MHRIEATLNRAWRGRGPLAWALLPLAGLYASVAALRRGLYRAGWLASESVGVPVIVVGNVVAGGAGKTPVVIELIRHCKARGIVAGVISRGHGRTLSRLLPDVREVLADSSASEAGDEPLLIQRATGAPIFVGRDRVGAARALLANHPEVRLIVSDDGLQHHALARDVEICVVGTAGAGNGWPLPAGPLREIGRRVAWVLDGRDPAARNAGAALGVTAEAGCFALARRLADHALGADGSRVPLAALAAQPLWAVAGIANPQNFFDMLGAHGLHIAVTDALPDHYDFNSYAGPVHESHRLICTEKDAVKLWRTHPKALAVPLETRIDPAFFTALDAWLDAFLETRTAAPLS